jgi:hypothetical protein
VQQQSRSERPNFPAARSASAAISTMVTVPLRSVPGMDGQTWVDGYRSRLAQIGTAAARSRERIGVDATASGGDGAVTVTVDALGLVRRVLFTSAAEQLSWVQLADAVVTAAGRARAQAAVEVLGRRVGGP